MRIFDFPDKAIFWDSSGMCKIFNRVLLILATIHFLALGAFNLCRAQDQIEGFVGAGSTGNTATITVTNPDEDISIDNVSLSLSSEPERLRNIRIEPDSEGPLQPGASRVYTIRFDVHEDAQAGVRETLSFKVFAEMGIVDHPNPQITVVIGHDDGTGVSVCALRADTPGSFPPEDAFQYCAPGVKEINEYDRIAVFFTPQNTPGEFRFRMTDPNGRMVSRGDFLMPQPPDDAGSAYLKPAREGSPGRFAVVLDLWLIRWLKKEPKKRSYIPGTYVIETIDLQPSSGTGLFGQGNLERKEQGQWKEAGRFDVREGIIHFAGFVAEPVNGLPMPRTDWRWNGQANIEKLEVDLETGAVDLHVGAWWRNTKLGQGGVRGPGDKVSKGRTSLKMVFPQSIRPGKVIQKQERRGSFLYPLEPVAEINIDWQVEGEENACYKPVFLHPTPEKGPPSRPKTLDGWLGRAAMDVSLDDTNALLRKSWTPAPGRSSIYRIGICSRKPFGMPTRTLPWHLRDPETVWLLPVKFTLTPDVEFYGYGVYRSVPGPYDGPQPGKPPWGDSPDVPTADTERTDDVADTERAGPVDPDTLDPADADVAGLIREWTSTARPPENAVPGSNWRYDPVGRVVGSGPGLRTTSTHDTVDYAGGAPEARAWHLRKKLDSIDHCTLEEYVVARLERKSISHCAGRYGALKNLKGERLDRAMAIVTGAGFKCDDPVPGSPATTAEANGRIERQEPGPDQYLKKGQAVKLVVYTPYVPGKVTLPSFIGEPLGEAIKWLERNKLKMQRPKAGSPAPSKKKSGTIEAQKPVAGTVMKTGGKVAFTVHSNYTDVRTVPKVVEFYAKKATELIEGAGLKADPKSGGKPPSRKHAGTVKRQSPEPRVSVPAGSKVAIYIYGPYVDATVVPDVRKLTYKGAKRRLKAAGLSIGKRDAGRPGNPDLAKTAQKQDPLPKTEVSRGTTVLVWFYGSYVPTREEQVAAKDCSWYPGSRAYWDDAEGKPMCGCFDGLRWNLNNSACVSQHDYARQWCDKNRPGSISVRKPDGSYECRCPDGYVWADNPRRCIQKTATADSNRDWRGWDRYQQCNHIISQIKGFMAMYKRDPRNNSHLKGIAEGNARQARTLGCDQGQINQALGTGGGGGTGDICPCVDENGRRYRVPFGQDCGMDLGIMSRDYNCPDDTGGGGGGTNLQRRPSSCQDPGMTNIHTLIDPPPWSGISKICRDGSGGLWIQTAGGIHSIKRIIRGQRNNQTGCYDGAKVVTQSRTYGGRLCGP
jgi:beta-lactam-binding protein with PASTA domain